MATPTCRGLPKGAMTVARRAFLTFDDLLDDPESEVNEGCDVYIKSRRRYELNLIHISEEFAADAEPSKGKTGYQTNIEYRVLRVE